MTKVPKEIIDEINRENSNIELLKNATPKKEEKKPEPAKSAELKTLEEIRDILKNDIQSK